jgi:cysteine-rich repeat protein
MLRPVGARWPSGSSGLLWLSMIGGCGLILDPRPRDAGMDAGSDAVDASEPMDAGEPIDAGEPMDAGELDTHGEIPDASAPDAPTEPDAGSASILTGGCRCGDGLFDEAAGEACDDGNDEPGDGCDGCVVEDGWTCALEPVPWVFPRPTGLGPMGVPSTEWTWAPEPTAPASPTYPVDEVECIAGYALRGLPTSTDFARCAQWASVGPSGCEAIGPMGLRYFRTTFVVPTRGGPITLGLGWDNFLQLVTVDGLPSVVVPVPTPIRVDGWPAPQAFVTIDVAPGLHTLELVVDEPQGPGPMNQTAISVTQVNPSVCERTP